MIKAVLFDLDGVLVDSEEVNIVSGTRAFADIGIKLSRSEQKLIAGRHPADYDEVFTKYKFDSKRMVKLHHKYYKTRYHKSKPFPFSRSFVIALKRKGFKLALVTASERTDARQVLRRLKLAGVFDVVVTFETCKHRKPSPLPYLTAARLLKVAPKDCAVVEDSIPGVESAKRAKMKCIAVTHTFPASKLKKADLIVKNLNDKRIWSLLC
jgi:HAD superfamily hydrolase (TIGR01509 family)